jgi:serine/threonine protein kinase
LSPQKADENRQQFLDEAKMMNKYRHPNLVQFIGVCYNTGQNKLFILSEFMPGGDLQKYLKKQQHKMNINLLIRIGFQILDGMIYLEQWKTIHRDLRTANVLVGLNDVCKISDFGLMLESNSRDANTKFPIRWTAPEAIRDVTQFSTKSDVWSFGILMVEVVTMGGNPYPELKDTKDVQHYVLSGKVHPRPAECPQSLYDCLKICWIKDAGRRPNFPGLRNTMEEQVLDPDGQYTGDH